MGIEKIDKNFAVEKASVTKDGKTIYTIPSEEFDLYGVFYDEKVGRFLRMDENVARNVSDGVNWLNKNTAGGRLRFSTDATLLELSVAYDDFCRMSHMTLLGSCGFILLEEREDSLKVAKIFPPTYLDEKGFTGVAHLEGGKMRDYILHFPLYNRVSELKIALNEGAKVQGGRKYRNIKPILYYGSSITQGGCASRPDNSYQAHIAKWNNIDFINLGFSGNGKAEPIMVDYLASIDCSLFVCDYDYNATNSEYLKATHYPLYERYRKARPDTPILFISRPDYEYGTDGLQREGIIRQTYLKAKKQGDKNVYFIPGRTLYGKVDRENCAVDSCHPNDLGFYRMAKKIYKKMTEIDEKFR